MKCTQCGTEFEGSFCPACGTRAAPPAGSAGAGQGAAQPPQSAGQAVQSATPSSCASANAGTVQQTMGEPPKAVEKPTPSPRVRQMSAAVLNKVVGNLQLPGAFLLLAVVYALGWCLEFIKTILLEDIIYLSLGMFLCTAIILTVFLLANYKFKWGTRVYTAFKKYFFSDKLFAQYRRKRPEQRLSKFQCSPKRLLILGILNFWAPVLCFLCAAIVGLTMGDLFANISAAFLIETGVYGLLCIAFIVYGIVYLKKYGKATYLAFYGREKPLRKDKPIVTYGQLGEELHAYQTAWENYLLYKPRKRSYERGTVFTSGNATTILWLRVNGLRILALLLSLGVIIYIYFVVLTYIWNPVRKDKAEYLEIGMGSYEVSRLLGDPFEGEESDGSSQYVWTYYDNYYTKLLERSAELGLGDVENAEDFMNTFAEALELESKLQTQEHGYIEVTFDEFVVAGVFYDPSRVLEDTAAKSLRERLTLSEEIEQGAETGTAVVTTEYEDGSLWKARVEGSLTEGAAETVGETVTLRCFDPYAQEYFTVQATVVEAADEPDAA